MAENVQLNTEKSIPELEQLERVGLFTKPEIKKIQKHRIDLEYKIARIQKAKEHYLKYIQYEISVLSLIKKRREKIGYKYKKKEIDSVIGKRINNLFKAAIRRYPEDTKLWITHREFLKKMNWHDNMSDMLTRMLQLHNKTPALWVTVAKWELEDSHSAETSRQLLQRAIRFHPESELVWREYFRMELIFVEQVRKRREVLGINENDETSDAVLEAKIPLTIFKNAVQTIPDVNFALSFLPICKEFVFAEEHRQLVLEHLRQNHRQEEIVWDALAKQCLEQQRPEKTNKKNFEKRIEEEAFIVYEDALQILATEKMWDFYLQLVLERLKMATKARKSIQLMDKMFLLSQRASQMGLLSKRMFLEWLKLLYSSGQADKVRSAALEGVKTRWPTDPLIWRYCLLSHASSTSPHNKEEFFSLFKQAVQQVPAQESLPLWRLGVEWASCGPVAEHLQDILEMSVRPGVHSQVCLPLKAVYLEMAAIFLGLPETRNIYDRLKKSQPVDTRFFQQMVDIELAQFDVDMTRIRKCYKEALLQFGDSSVDIWLNWSRMELEHPLGQPTSVGKIYQDAVKTLTPGKSDQFIASYVMLKNKQEQQQEEEAMIM